MSDPYLTHLTDQASAETADADELIGSVVAALHSPALGCVGPAEECEPCAQAALAIVEPVRALVLEHETSPPTPEAPGGES